jgi:hypothetical protein
MSKRTKASTHRRGDVLRAVVDDANTRRDGVLPMELPGVAETFRDELDLVAALQLRWHTRLAGHIERALMDEPMELESSVLTAWRNAATELVGVRMILDAYTAHPTSVEMDNALRTAARKDWSMLAAMAGKAAVNDEGAPAVGRALEEQARTLYRPTLSEPRHRAEPTPSRADTLRTQIGGRLTKLKAHLAA